jgi:hypothetical protein
MSIIGNRIDREKEVLATLLLVDYAYKELPEDFSIDEFECPDYKYLFKKFREYFIETGKPASCSKLNEMYPELKSLITDITFASIPLNGKLKARASALKMHQQLVTDEDNQVTSEPIFLQSNNKKQDFEFELYNGLEISQMEIPKESFLIENLITENSVNFLSGEEGCGKSLLAMNLAISVSVGASKWLSYNIKKHGKVLYLNNELAFSDFVRREKAMSNSLPASGAISNLIVPKEVPALNECWETLNRTCEIEKPCLIVVDCLYFTHDKDENDSSEMKALMRQFLTLRNKYNLTLLLIHHTKKNSRYEKMHNDQMRGSNVFSGVTDTVLQIRRSAADERKRIIKPTKFRHVSDENRKCRLLSLNTESLWFIDEGETNEDEHIARATPTAEDEIDFRSILKDGEQISRKEILERCKHLGYDERTIDRQLKKAKGKDILKVPKYGYYSH